MFCTIVCFSRLPLFVFIQLLLFAVIARCEDTSEVKSFRQAFPLVNPSADHTKLEVDERGLEVLKRITTSLAPVVVIGPYRSGKSFLLNQLLQVPCNEGFGVGHKRDTQTKGIWIWGEPKEVLVNKQKVAVVYMDTEGFESTGKPDAYDDRIFALSAILSSVLIYNLPETVKETDIEKLSFAAELAEEFFSRVNGEEEPLTPPHLLWLIQRDFLEGKTVQQMVKAALKPVANPDGEHSLDNVNRIRKSLVQISRNSTAFGLKQPHIQRTKLCELHDKDLERDYVRQREQLKQLVTGMVVGKHIGKAGLADGHALAKLVQDTVAALNEGEIPQAGSVVDAFNRDVLHKCLKLYETVMAREVLPVSAEALQSAHEAALAEAQNKYRTDRFGHRELPAREVEVYEKEYKALVASNALESARLCESLHSVCEDTLEVLQGMRLPSLKKFDRGSWKCNSTLHESCVGPSAELYQEKMRKAISRERSHFLSEYNQRLYNGLLAIAVVMVIFYRFIVKNSLLEFASWLLFLFLEVYPKLYFGSTVSFYESEWWQKGVTVWEAIAYNRIIDLERQGPVLLAALGVLVLVYRVFRWRKRRQVAKLKRVASEKDVDV